MVLPMVKDDAYFARLAVAEARKCTFDPDEVSPFVGAVAVREGRVLAAAYRGEIAPGEHAEYTLLERKLASETLAGATIYTTLEPCTRRNPLKIPCVKRLIERRVARVMIGTLDRNPDIQGNGEWALRDAGIKIGRFPPDVMSELEELNRNFFRTQEQDRKHRSHVTPTAPIQSPNEVKESIFVDWYGEMFPLYPAEELLWWEPNADGEQCYIPQA
jgi:pyrimidine deaminase RibD-like protein